MKSYAQDKEDIIIKQLLPDVINGFYIDIGANDPDEYSVTKLFYNSGWHGINIEPLPEVYKSLKIARTADINLNIGVGDVRGRRKLYIDNGEYNMGSTFDKEVAKDLNDYIEVDVWTMDYILNMYRPNEIHFCKIDVEGYERQVLSGFDWSFRPWVFCIESTVPGTDEPCYDKWENILTEHGYILAYAHGINRYYADAIEHPYIIGRTVEL